ncbi:MAG: branched-chain amino acid aminotransferase [Rhodospirillaceae bacterium]|nr:branched-chain amino acid aminotransferase [Rhodospirillaceae bacterium]
MATTPYDDRDGFIWMDGEFVPWRDARVHVLTHALHYASAVFEGERAYAGRIFKLEEHTERLFHSAQVLNFEIPYTQDQVNDACKEVLARNGITDGYVRPIAWRGSEMMGVSAQANTIHRGIAAWEWPAYFTPEARLAGIRLTTSRWRRPAPDTAPTNSKAAGLYMICTISKHAAEAAGYNDALMLDWRGRVAETTGANFFLVKDGVINTPIPDCFLDGITRRTVMDLARQAGFEVVERAIVPSELATADEIFITGTAAEVTPVNTIDEMTFSVGPITKQLMEAYDACVRAHASDQSAQRKVG